MGVGKVLAFLTNELERRGADLLSIADLDALSIVQATLDDAGVTDEDARAVAWIVALAPRANRLAVREAFGGPTEAFMKRLVPSDLVGMRRPAPGGSGRLELRIAWARATADVDPAIRYVAAALLAAERAHVAGPGGDSELLGILDLAIAEAKHQGTRDLLESARGTMPAAPGPSTTPAVPPRPLLLSLSIDVAGSTAAKAMMRALAEDPARRDQLYADFYEQFLRAEARFYGDLFEPWSWDQGPPLDWRKLFVVKGIGDEVWMTYDLTDHPPDPAAAKAWIGRISVRVLSAALGLVAQTIQVGGFERDLGPDFDPAAEDATRHESMRLPFKVSMDLLEDAIEISAMRAGHLTRQVGAFLVAGERRPGSPPVDPKPFGADDVELLNRLNAGTFALVGGRRVRQVHRTDLIGNDVDRFFRITGEALPGCVMVGERLFERLSLISHGSAGPGVERVELLHAVDPLRPTDEVRSGHPLLAAVTVLPAGKLKGIDEPYAVRHLITPSDLRGLWASAPDEPLLAKTVAKLPPSLRDEIGADKFTPSA